MNKAVFLDRDGVINYDYGYVYKFSDFKFIEGVIEALAYFKAQGFKLILVTNQSGIARGYYSEEDFATLTCKMQAYLSDYQAQFDGIYYCPHLVNAKIKKYSIDCECRKPKAKMFFDAIRDFDLDVTQSYMFGDKISDLQAASKAKIAHLVLVNNDEALSSDLVYEQALSLHDYISTME